MGKDTTKRIFLWSGPRNISTALMYAFAQRSDTKVYDEPLYGYYLSHTEAKEYHPGSKEILDTMDHDGDQVVRMMLTTAEKPIVFFKNMCHHLLDLDRSFMAQGENVILTREPVEMLSSFGEVIDNPQMHDVGYKSQVDLMHDLISRGIPVTVVDSKTILMDPSRQLESLCHKLGISFEPEMLSWSAGAREEDGIWAPYWYSNVHRSTGFAPYKPKERPFPEKLRSLLDDCQPFYEELMKFSL
ncbi:MAG TPA: hypothetical protein VK957_15980 [Lunatimonas sp.]|nr:hypothetical protein [Lunatimonas sp.]